MKKLLFAAVNLDVGGIETALITLLNYLSKLKEGNKYKYDITLVLEEAQGIFFSELDEDIKVIEYKPNNNKNILKRKLINLKNRINFIIKYRNKFDYSCSYATYSKPASFVARTTSKNRCLWIHSDYTKLYNENIERVKNFFKEIQYEKFKKFVFVSKEARKNLINIFPNIEKKSIVCNNIINADKIIKLSNEHIDIKKEENITTFINVSRHEEKAKKITRIIEASELIKQHNKNFRVLLIGDGEDSKLYEDMIKSKKLDKNVILLGRKKNPYPYIKISDCVILTSDYEGYPVVFLESFILKKPIITTKVSDYQDIEGKYGYVTTNETNDIYEKMKIFTEKGFEIDKDFNDKKYNEEIIKKLEKIF